MTILRRPFEESENLIEKGCGCDIYTGGGDCKHVDDGGCGCDH